VTEVRVHEQTLQQRVQIAGRTQVGQPHQLTRPPQSKAGVRSEGAQQWGWSGVYATFEFEAVEAVWEGATFGSLGLDGGGGCAVRLVQVVRFAQLPVRQSRGGLGVSGGGRGGGGGGGMGHVGDEWMMVCGAWWCASR
jgi:hypothetical protein